MTTKENDCTEKKAIYRKGIIIGIIAALVLVIAFMWFYRTIIKPPEPPKLPEVTNEEYYYYYMNAYYEALDNLNEEDFDEEFRKVYSAKKMIVDRTEYRLTEVYLVKLVDGSVYINKAGDNHTDMITNEEFEGSRKITIALRNASVFYELYKDGVIKVENDEIRVAGATLKKYADAWDGSKQTEIRELKADAIASEKYRQKYGWP